MTEYKELNLKSRIVFTIPVFILSAAIFIASQQTNIDYPKIGIEWEDKVLHASAYFIYGISLLFAFISNKPNSKKKTIITMIITLGFLFAMSDEIHQYFVPGRSADILDWLADCIGISLSLLFFEKIKLFIKKYF